MNRSKRFAYGGGQILIIVRSVGGLVNMHPAIAWLTLCSFRVDSEKLPFKLMMAFNGMGCDSEGQHLDKANFQKILDWL
jgi:hypothetical protein